MIERIEESTPHLEEYGTDYRYHDEVIELFAQKGWKQKAREITLAGLEDYMSLGLKPGDRVLDVGSGLGVRGNYLRYGGVKTFGVDFDIQAIGKGRNSFGKHSRNVPIVADTTLNLPFRDEAFDFVRSSEFFEHLPYPKAAIEVFKEMQRVSRNNRMLHLITVIEDGEHMDADPTHHIKWTASGWREFFKDQGWETIRPTDRRLIGKHGIYTYKHGFFLLEKSK